MMKTTQAGVQKGRVLCATKHVLGKTPKIGVGRDHLLSIMLSLFSSFAVPVRFPDGCEMRVERGECQIKDGGNSFHTSPACPPAGGASLGFVAFSAQNSQTLTTQGTQNFIQICAELSKSRRKESACCRLVIKLFSVLCNCATVDGACVRTGEGALEPSFF